MLNLDAMSKSDLSALYKEIFEHPRLSAKKYGLSVKDAKNIMHYAINKWVAMDLRAGGKIERAKEYEAICDRIYDDLSTDAQW